MGKSQTKQNRHEHYSFARQSIPAKPPAPALKHYGRIVLLGPQDDNDKLKRRVFSRKLPTEFTLRGVRIDREAAVETNLLDLSRALDYSVGLLVIELTDQSRNPASFTHELQRGALKIAAKKNIPALVLLPSCDHLYVGLFGKAEAAQVQAVFCGFKHGSREHSNVGDVRGMFRSVADENFLFWPRWHNRAVATNCLRQIVQQIGGYEGE